MRGLGKGVHEYKKGLAGEDDEQDKKEEQKDKE